MIAMMNKIIFIFITNPPNNYLNNILLQYQKYNQELTLY